MWHLYRWFFIWMVSLVAFLVFAGCVSRENIFFAYAIMVVVFSIGRLLLQVFINHDLAAYIL